jgi:hypothetical protein
MPECLDEEEVADWRSGRDAVYRLAGLTIGADAQGEHLLRTGNVADSFIQNAT